MEDSESVVQNIPVSAIVASPRLPSLQLVKQVSKAVLHWGEMAIIHLGFGRPTNGVAKYAAAIMSVEIVQPPPKLHMVTGETVVNPKMQMAANGCILNIALVAKLYAP